MRSLSGSKGLINVEQELNLLTKAKSRVRQEQQTRVMVVGRGYLLKPQNTRVYFGQGFVYGDVLYVFKLGRWWNKTLLLW